MSKDLKRKLNKFINTADKLVEEGKGIKEALDQASNDFSQEDLNNMAQWIIDQFAAKHKNK